MLDFLPAFLRVPLTALSIALNTVVHCVPLLALTFMKLALPIPPVRRLLSRALTGVAESWIAVNGFLFWLLTQIEWEVEGLEGLRRDGWYLVVSNHQSWVDIPALQKVFNRRIPFLKFFLKQELIWVPLLGVASWALDFPFMKRYSKATLARRPDLRGKDLETTRKACRKFRNLPVSIVNFVEGTRFKPEKHAAQGSPYRYLLRPRAGGVAFVLATMGDVLQSIIDVTILYPGGAPTFVDLAAGRVRRIQVIVRQRPIPAEMTRGDYQNDPAFRARFQQWISELWAEKDALIAERLGAPVDAAASRPAAEA